MRSVLRVTGTILGFIVLGVVLLVGASTWSENVAQARAARDATSVTFKLFRGMTVKQVAALRSPGIAPLFMNGADYGMLMTTTDVSRVACDGPYVVALHFSKGHLAAVDAPRWNPTCL